MAATAGDAELAGLRVLVVEADFLIAQEMERMLTARGAVVLGLMHSVERAMAQIEADPPDVAVIDLGLLENSVVLVAEALKARGAALVLVSGYPEAHKPELRDAPLLQKPVSQEQLAYTVADAAYGIG